MIEQRQVIARARQLYADIKKRSAATYWKIGRMKGSMRWAGVPVPYSSDEFAEWLVKTVGVQAFLCPYCNAPLDVLSMSLDHDVPLHGGGTNEFSNLVPCCGSCNQIKGKMCATDFNAFRRMLRQLTPMGEADVLSRLRSGGMGQRMTWDKSKKSPDPVLSNDNF